MLLSLRDRWHGPGNAVADHQFSGVACGLSQLTNGMSPVTLALAQPHVGDFDISLSFSALRTAAQRQVEQTKDGVLIYDCRERRHYGVDREAR